MKNMLKAILLHELLMLLMGIGLTTIIVVLYRDYDHVGRVVLSWFVVLQIIVAVRVIKGRRRGAKERGNMV